MKTQIVRTLDLVKKLFIPQLKVNNGLNFILQKFPDGVINRTGY